MPALTAGRAGPVIQASSSLNQDQRRVKLVLQATITRGWRNGTGEFAPHVWQASMQTRPGAPSAGTAHRVRSLATGARRDQTVNVKKDTPAPMG